MCLLVARRAWIHRAWRVVPGRRPSQVVTASGARVNPRERAGAAWRRHPPRKRRQDWWIQADPYVGRVRLWLIAALAALAIGAAPAHAISPTITEFSTGLS